MKKLEMLQLLSDKVKVCEKCSDLVKNRTKTVFGEGNPEADIVFIGEAPGKNEDESGRPFVGAAGDLLNKIIAAHGLKREDIFICNILKCRPPKNRRPEPQECDNCLPYLKLQLKIINPKYIVCWGSVAAQTLLKNNTSIGRLRGQWFKYENAKVIVTWHPSYALQYGGKRAKDQIGEDLQMLIKEINACSSDLLQTKT